MRPVTRLQPFSLKHVVNNRTVRPAAAHTRSRFVQRASAGEEKLRKFVQEKGINCTFKGASEMRAEDDTRILCLLDEQKGLIVGITNKEDEPSGGRVQKALQLAVRPRNLTADEVTNLTEFNVVGLPALGYAGTFVIDDKVMGKSSIFIGGGDAETYIEITPAELQKATSAQVARVRR